MADHSSFGALLKSYRQTAGLTQEALAERAGLSADAISTLERGLRLAPRRDTVRLLADALQLSAGDRAVLEGSVQRHRGPPRAAASLPAVASSPPHPAAPAAAGETRVLTILFADLTGSVQRTAHLYPEDAAALVNDVLTTMVDAILKCEGRINRLLGDAVLAFFGSPVAHENDPERAILAALDLRAAVQKLGLNVTVGINMGQVYLGAIGAEQHQEITAQGPVVNLAARLREKAQPGQILVGEAVYRQTRRAFEFAQHLVEAKGFAEPVAAYEVVRPLPRPEKLRGIEGVRAPLIGRDAEFAQLEEALTAVLGGRGQLVALIGEAGVGKSRLIGELRAVTHGPAVGQPAPLWLEGRCLDVGMAVSYWPFLDVLRAYVGWSPDEDERATGARLVAALQDLVQHGALTAARCEEMLPFLGTLLSVRFGDARDARLANAGPEEIKHQTFLALRDLFLALPRRRPVILILEDLHWADSLSMDVVGLLMEALARAPLLLVCVYRPAREHKSRHLGTIAARKCPECYTELHLRDLSPQQSRRLMEALLPIEAIPAAVTEQILAQAQGNPLFLEEMVRSLIDAGLVYHDGAGWRARAEISGVAVPESVQSIILSRVDRLEANAKQVLQRAAVIGRLFRRRLLGQLMPLEAELDRALTELEDRMLIYEDRAIPEEEYSFQHVLTQQTVYQNMLRRQRAELHRQVAAAMERLYGDSLEEYYEQLAAHYTQGEAWHEALHYLMKAGDKATAAYANQEAQDFYARASAVCEALGEAAVATAASVAQKRGFVTFGMGDLPGAQADFDRMLRAARACQDRRLEGLALGYRGMVEFFDRTFEKAEETLRAALAVAAEGCDEVRLLASAWLSVLYLTINRPADAAPLMRVVEELAPKVDDPFSQAWGGLIAGMVPYWAGRFDEALAVLERWRAPATANVATLLLCEWVEALIRASKGEYQQALALLEDILETSRRTGDVSCWACTLNTLGWVYGELQDHQRALEWNTHGLTAAQEMNDPECESNARLNLGDSLLALGRLDEAEAHFVQTQCEHRQGSCPPQDRWALWLYRQHLCHSYGELWLARGDEDQARACADECLRLAEATGRRKNIVKARRLRGQVLLAQGKPAEAEPELEAALQIAWQVGNPPQLWKTLVALGDLRTAQGRPADACQAYRDALQIIEGVAAALSGASVRETFLASPHVRHIRGLAV